MARTVRDEKLGSRTARAILQVRGKPYYRAIDEGLHIGYRKNKTSGKWVGRFYNKDIGGYEVETLPGVADDTRDPDGVTVLSFSQAQTWIRERAERQKAGARPSEPEKPYTVGDALDAHLEYLKEKPQGAWRDAKWRIEALIRPQLGQIGLADLTTEKLQQWLKATANAPPRLRTRKGAQQQYGEIDPSDQEAQRRRQASAKRVWTILKAALNQAWRDNKVKNLDDKIWRSLKPFEDVDAARVRWHPIEECRRLINASPGAFRTLVHAALHSGARYGLLTTFKVGDFSVHPVHQLDGRTHRQGILRGVVYKGRGRPKQIVISLTDEATEFFEELTAGRDTADWMLLKDDGTPWGKSHQDRLIKEASHNAKIEPRTNFNVLRHTWASHAVMNGMPLMVVAKNLGHSDTRMVERHYGHLAPSYVALEVQARGPRFGIKSDSSVARVEARG